MSVKQSESSKRTAPAFGFGTAEARPYLNQFEHTELSGPNNDRKFMDKIKYRAHVHRFPCDTRKSLSDEGMQCSPGPIYKPNVPKGVSRSIGEHTNTFKLQEFDEREWNNFAHFGRKTHFSRLKSGRKCGFGSYSSREQPVLHKLDPSW
jgi:hypothetical protein